MGNPPFEDVYVSPILKMVVFHCYVSLPEGIVANFQLKSTWIFVFSTCSCSSSSLNSPSVDSKQLASGKHNELDISLTTKKRGVPLRMPVFLWFQDEKYCNFWCQLQLSIYSIQVVNLEFSVVLSCDFTLLMLLTEVHKENHGTVFHKVKL